MKYMKYIFFLVIIFYYLTMNNNIEAYPNENQFLACDDDFIYTDTEYKIHKNEIKEPKKTFLNKILEINDLKKDENIYFKVPICDSINTKTFDKKSGLTKNRNIEPWNSNEIMYGHHDVNNIDTILYTNKLNKLFLKRNREYLTSDIRKAKEILDTVQERKGTITFQDEDWDGIPDLIDKDINKTPYQ